MTLGELLDTLNGIHGAIGPAAESIPVFLLTSGDGLLREPTIDFVSSDIDMEVRLVFR